MPKYYDDCYKDYCTVCGRKFPNRDMNKIYLSYGHKSVPAPKVIAGICDNCLPRIFDALGIPERE